MEKGGSVNTRTIIILLRDGIVIRDEYTTRSRGLTFSQPRIYLYDTMTPSSFGRIVKLQDHPNSITRLVPWAKIKQADILIYWKREHPRPRHD